MLGKGCGTIRKSKRGNEESAAREKNDYGGFGGAITMAGRNVASGTYFRGIRSLGTRSAKYLRL